MEIVFYRVAEFCEKFVISKSSFYREVRAGRLLLIKRGRSTLITRVEAERWFAGLNKKRPSFDTAKLAQTIQQALRPGAQELHPSASQ